MVRKRLFGLFTRITRMSERPQLGIMNVFCRPSTVPMAEPRSAPKRFDTSWCVAVPEGLPAALSDSASGRELIDLGYADDVAIAAEVDHSVNVTGGHVPA